jgi:hypothetical protein
VSAPLAALPFSAKAVQEANDVQANAAIKSALNNFLIFILSSKILPVGFFTIFRSRAFVFLSPSDIYTHGKSISLEKNKKILKIF